MLLSKLLNLDEVVVYGKAQRETEGTAETRFGGILKSKGS